MFEEVQEGAMSNMQTLLDAAKFVECTNTPDRPFGARVPSPPEFHHYAKSPPDQNRSNSGSDTCRSDQNDDNKDRRKSGGAGNVNREVHNILEKNRRAHLKECFDGLRLQIPTLENQNKVSNLSILRGALKYIQVMKRKEKELEYRLQQLTMVKIQRQQDVALLQKDLNKMNIVVDVSHFMPPPDEDTRSVSTATAHNNSPIMSEDEDFEMESTAKVKVEIIESVQKPKPPLTFCNVFSSPLTSPQPASHAIQATNVTKSRLPVPLFAMRNVATNKMIHSQTSAVSNNKTIAAMLSTSAQSPVPDGIIPLTASVCSMVGSTTKTVPSCTSQSFPANSLVSLLPNNLLTTGNTTAATVSTGKPVAHDKASVTQLLQQTLAQRAQLQQLAKLQQVQHPTAIVVSASSSALTPTINVAQISTMPQVITMNASSLRPLAALTVPHLRPSAALNHVLPTTFTLNSSGQLVTTSVVNAGGGTSSHTIPQAALNKTENITVPSTTVATSGVAAATAIVNQLGLASTGNVSVPGLSGLQALNLSDLKSILTLPIAQLPGTTLASQHVNSLQQLMSQAVAKSTAFRGSAGYSIGSDMTPVTTSVTLAPTALTQVTPAASMTSNPITQFLPINVVTPGVSGQSGALNQVNLANTAINSQVLKSLGLPILQQPISLPIKPIVMVKVANATTSSMPLATASAATLQVNAPITHS